MDNLELRALLFVALVVFVFIAAANLLLVRLYSRICHTRPPQSTAYLVSERAILAGASIALVCILYARFVEPFWPKVIHVQVASRKLAPGAHPLRIVQISDVHSDARPRLENRLPEIIAAQKPDLIVFTGDSVNSRGAISIFRELMSNSARIAPAYASRGNWDEWAGAHQELFAGTGVEELNGQAVRREFHGTPIWIGGLATENTASVTSVFAGAPANEFRLLLHHFPDRIIGGYDGMDAAAGSVDLFCAGHTHGGQVALPIYGALVTFSRFGKRFEWGLHRVGETWLYVNRRIGMEGGRAPRIRFWARPEITVIDLVPAA